MPFKSFKSRCISATWQFPAESFDRWGGQEWLIDAGNHLRLNCVELFHVKINIAREISLKFALDASENLSLLNVKSLRKFSCSVCRTNFSQTPGPALVLLVLYRSWNVLTWQGRIWGIKGEGGRWREKVLDVLAKWRGRSAETEMMEGMKDRGRLQASHLMMMTSPYWS